MDCDNKSASSRRYDVKYASNDALNTKKRYPHVQSKVKVYIENMRKEDQERRKANITRHRSEPSELAEWNAFDKLNESGTDSKLMLEKKNRECEELKLRLTEMKAYGDAMNQLLNAERLENIEHKQKLLAFKKHLKVEESCTWSDPGLRGGDPIVDNDKTGRKGISITGGAVEMYIEDDVFNSSSNSIEWLGKVTSEEEIADENDQTILLQPVHAKPSKKGMKYRVKKLLRCCAPCIKPKVV